MSRVYTVGVVVGLTGFAILFVIDWRVGLGVFLCLYGNNLTQHY
jgi:hypothetical protein